MPMTVQAPYRIEGPPLLPADVYLETANGYKRLGV